MSGYFNPRTPCGARLAHVLTDRLLPEFQSTHPLRGATRRTTQCVPIYQFQSTHPLRGATGTVLFLLLFRIYFNPRTPCGARHRVRTSSSSSNPISIHAPLAGRDSKRHRRPHRSCISIHAPLAGRDQLPISVSMVEMISIHAPLAGRDLASSCFLPQHPHFNPRTPCGARLWDNGAQITAVQFQSTHPLRGATTAV